ncbi:MAG: adenylyltransferase/cytidyltransferase family protein [Thermoleophilia bacterium]
MVKYKYGQVHGRFQPFHNGHLEYIIAAKQRCDFLWVGITQINIRELAGSNVDIHRAEPGNNPLTFFERLCLIRDVLSDKGFEDNEFMIAPFPIEYPEILLDYLSTDIPIFTTIYDKWNEHKIELLNKAGYHTEILWKRDFKEIQGTVIRKSIYEGKLDWKDSVPDLVKIFIERNNIQERLKLLINNKNA